MDIYRPQNIEDAVVAVIGLNVTGLACASILPHFGAEVVLSDTRPLAEIRDKVMSLIDSGYSYLPISEIASLSPDFIIVSPGLDPRCRSLDPLRDLDAEWVSEIELASHISRGRIFAITGTNGKTTATTLAGQVLGKKFSDVRVCGNIGRTFIESVIDSTDDTVYVIEVSSYQLEGCTFFKPDVAVELNLSEDHLKRHGDMDGYAGVKAKMVATLTADDYAVLNADDRYVSAMAAATAGRVLEFSTSREVEQGAYYDGKMLRLKIDGVPHDICAADELLIEGSHNIANVLAIAAGAAAMGVSAREIAETAKTFRGLEHRIEPVAEINGVRFVNDSKGTNPDSVFVALDAFRDKPVVLIVGGDDKGFEYTALYNIIARREVRTIVLGEGLVRMAHEMERRGDIDFRRVPDMKSAVWAGYDMLGAGGVVLLSPGSSSFDLYKNFEERGKHFKSEVAALEAEVSKTRSAC